MVYGLSESKLAEILQDVAIDEPGFHLAFLPRFPVIRLRLDVSGMIAVQLGMFCLRSWL